MNIADFGDIGRKITIYVPGIYKAVSPSFVIQRAFNIF
jgi:hypothetical protein